MNCKILICDKIRLVFYLLLFSGMMAFGQHSNEENQKLTHADVAESLKVMSEAILNGYSEKNKNDSKVISREQLKIYEDVYKTYCNLPEIEKLTGYSREWYGKLLKIVQELEKVSAEINNAILNVHMDKLEQLNMKYEELLKFYKQTYGKPLKPK